MRCVFSVNNGNVFSNVVIEKDGVCFINNNGKQVLDVDSKTCFNTLISLYSLRERWKKIECFAPVYKISFENEIYEFDFNNLPDNFCLFLSYISRLVGGSI